MIRLYEADALSFLKTSNSNFLSAFKESTAFEALSEWQPRYAYRVLNDNNFYTILKAYSEVFNTLADMGISVKSAGSWKEYGQVLLSCYSGSFDSNIFLEGTTEEEMLSLLETVKEAWENLGLSTSLDKNEMYLEAPMNLLLSFVRCNITFGYYGDNRLCMSLELSIYPRS